MAVWSSAMCAMSVGGHWEQSVEANLPSRPVVLHSRKVAKWQLAVVPSQPAVANSHCTQSAAQRRTHCTAL